MRELTRIKSNSIRTKLKKDGTQISYLEEEESMRGTRTKKKKTIYISLLKSKLSTEKYVNSVKKIIMANHPSPEGFQRASPRRHPSSVV